MTFNKLPNLVTLPPPPKKKSVWTENVFLNCIFNLGKQRLRIGGGAEGWRRALTSLCSPPSDRIMSFIFGHFSQVNLHGRSTYSLCLYDNPIIFSQKYLTALIYEFQLQLVCCKLYCCWKRLEKTKSRRLWPCARPHQTTADNRPNPSRTQTPLRQGYEGSYRSDW